MRSTAGIGGLPARNKANARSVKFLVHAVWSERAHRIDDRLSRSAGSGSGDRGAASRYHIKGKLWLLVPAGHRPTARLASYRPHNCRAIRRSVQQHG